MRSCNIKQNDKPLYTLLRPQFSLLTTTPLPLSTLSSFTVSIPQKQNLIPPVL